MDDIAKKIYTTYLEKASELGIEAISIDEFAEVIDKSKIYMKELHKVKGSHPYAVIPIGDDYLYLLAQLNSGVVNVGIHTGEAINDIIGDDVIDPGREDGN